MGTHSNNNSDFFLFNYKDGEHVNYKNLRCLLQKGEGKKYCAEHQSDNIVRFLITICLYFACCSITVVQS